jgi:electron transport complex protein RnfD
MNQLLTISASPHIHTRRTVSWCMWQVVVALIPALACALYFFGVGAAVVIAVSILGCVATEYLITRFMLRRPATIYNGSAILTGLLLAFNLPSNLPVWIVLIGAVVAIGIGKMAFGGLGCNIFNPALVGRVFLLLSFPAQMTTWPLPGVNMLNYVDATTGATLLTAIKMGQVDASSIDLWREVIGLTGGSLGEVGGLALLLGLAYMLARRVISWHIPVSIIVTVALMSLALGLDPLLQILSGGLLLGAVFMATDYVTSPMTRAGMLIYGVMIGVLTVVIRQWAAYPEGMSFAILIMNGLVPLINRYVKPRRFGERRATR